MAMEAADLELTQQAFGNTPQAIEDARLAVRFFKKAVPNPIKTQKEARLIADEEDFVTIANPGDTTLINVRKATEEDKVRFPRQWAAYQRNLSQDVASGTPLEVLLNVVPPILNLGQVEEFKYFKVTTVEQLANLADNVTSRFMGGNSLKQKAGAFLAAAKDKAPEVQLRAELSKRDATIEAQAQQIKELAEAVDKISKKQAKQ